MNLYKKICLYIHFVAFVFIFATMVILDSELPIGLIILVAPILSFTGYLLLALSTVSLPGIYLYSIFIIGIANFFQWAYLFPWAIRKVEKVMEKKIMVKNGYKHR